MSNQKVSSGQIDQSGDFNFTGELKLKGSPIVSSVDSIKSLSVPTVTGQSFSVAGFYSGTTVGGGEFVWDASRSKVEHDGILYYAPEALNSWDGTVNNLTSLLNWTGTGAGVFVKLSECTSSNIGCTNTKSSDAITKFYDSGLTKLIVDNDINIEKAISVNGDFLLVGDVKNRENPEVLFSSTSEMKGVTSTGGSATISGIKFKSGGTVDQIISLINKDGVRISDSYFDFSGTTAPLSGLSGGIYCSNLSNALFENNEFTGAWRDHVFNSGSAGGFGGNNLARTVNIENTAINSNVKFINNKFEDVWSAVYINNTSDILFERNYVKDTADSGFFDRCTVGYSRNKRFLNNDFYNIGKAAIKTLDTNNANPLSYADDSLVEGNNIYGWGLFIVSEAILAGRGYDGSYVRQELKQKGFRLIDNNFIQSPGSPTKRPFNFPNLDNPEISGNTVRLLDDDSANQVYILQWPRGGKIYNNEFYTNSDVIVSYKQEGTLKVSSNKFVIGARLGVDDGTTNIDRHYIFENNEIINNGTVLRGFALLVSNVSDRSFLKFVGNSVETTIAYQDSRETEAKNMIEASYDMPSIIDNNTIKFSDRYAIQKSIAGDILNPIYYRGSKGSARNVGDGTILFKATNERLVNAYKITGV